MKKDITLLIVILFCYAGSAKAQSYFSSEFSGGFEICTWNTKLNNGIYSDLALNHSGFNSCIPVKISLFYNFAKISFGIELKNQYAYISELYPSLDPGSTIKVSESSGFNFMSFFTVFKLQMIGGNAYRMTSNFGFGSFLESSTHNQKAYFTNKFAMKLSVSNELHKEQHYLFLNPTIQANTFNEREFINHNLLSFGIEAGIGFKIGK